MSIGFSIVAGFCASLMWIAHGSFMDQVSNDPSQKARLVGTFWAIF